MKSILKRLIKFFAYLAAGIVILLAIAVGLFRLFLPRLPEYQEEIKEWASTAIGVQVDFSGMDARWGLSGPELNFYDAELIRPDTQVRIVAAEEVRVGVGLMRLLIDRTLVIDQVVIRDTSIDVRQLDDGSLRIQGSPLDELLELRPENTENQANVQVIGEDLEVRFMQPGDERPRFFDIPRVSISVDEKRVAVDADIRLPDNLGRQVRASGTQVLSSPVAERSWDITVEAEDINLAGWSDLTSAARRFRSGTGDIDLALAFANGRVTSATAELEFVEIALADDDIFDLSGRIEIDMADDGWLIAANELVIAMASHDWPTTSIRFEASTDADGEIVMIDTRASYLNLDDVKLVDPWLTDEQRQMMAVFAPSGIVTDFAATVSEIGTDETHYNVSAELTRVGIAEAPGRPGLRGFSGLLRADTSGGRVEINASNLQIYAPEFVAGRIDLNTAEGTVIWRRSNNRTTVLSDSIRIEADGFDSQSNVQLILSNDGTAPEIDLSSTWSIADIAAAKRYIPQKVMTPKLYDWFQMALVSGSIPRGTTQLNGPLDKYPFAGGEGQLLINAAVRNMTFKYHKDWPAAEQADMDVVLDNARLYTERNRSTSAGNSVVNAKIDIPNLREPILTIESLSTGTLESIRQFSLQSPISKVFGGQLDRVSVAGDASFTLNLKVPLKRIKEFEFVSHVRSSNGSLSIKGFNPTITEVIGEVTIERDEISSESLGGRFLGQTVNIALQRSQDPQFAVIAVLDGIATAEGVVNELGVPLQGLINGAANYQAKILFPSAKVESPSPLTIQVDSDFVGFEFDLPEPLQKARETPLQVSGDIRFMPGGEAIESAGFAENQLAWQLAFNRPEDNWDLDRGVVTLGGGVMEAADTRGLHIRGATDVVRLQKWLDLSRRGAKNVGAADRIRSVDLRVENLYVIGQHLEDHRVRVDRSAQDWLVQLDGDDVVGSVFVPYDFGGDRAMVLEMQKLRMPGDDVNDDSIASIDPTKLPAITMSAEDFAFGDRYLGSVTASVQKIAGGLQAVAIQSKDATFEIVGNGRWVIDEDDPLGSHSYITATLSSTDVMQTMTRLNYDAGIASNNMGMLFNLDWSGGPRAEFFDVLGGDVEVRLDKGQLQEVEPGAGRMFGLMSIVALPRRLSLDFRDVFSKGFGFDKIAGTFRIVDGITYTCDLSLEGPAANIGIVGAVDLSTRTYDQTAIVSANVGNSLPIVGAVVAGPQVAAAMLIFSQIFKKPLQEVGQVYYSIDGSWDEANVQSTNSDAFVSSGELAGCLTEAEAAAAEAEAAARAEAIQAEAARAQAVESEPE